MPHFIVYNHPSFIFPNSKPSALPIFSMPLKNSTIVSELKMEEAVKFEAKTNCKNKEWSSFLCILGLSSEKSKKEKLDITGTLLFISESMSLKK